MTTLKSILIAGVVAYAAILAFLFLAQRRIMYFPDANRVAPATTGFSQAQALELKTADGETIVAWFAPPRPGKPLILYFHGNAGQIAGRAARFAAVTQDGAGLLAVSYRGYGGSSGAPSEDGLIADAMAGYRFALANGIAAEQIVLFGESLGSGVAIALAAQVKTGSIILEAPFSSAADVAASTYWMFPVRLLMRDQFRSAERIGLVRAPILIVHGTADPVIPIGLGEKLFGRANEPKAFMRIENAGHQPLDNPAALQRMREWLSKAQEYAGR